MKALHLSRGGVYFCGALVLSAGAIFATVNAADQDPEVAHEKLGMEKPAEPTAAKVDFSRDVLPILSVSCFQCHGPDANQRKAHLRLDNREGALAQRDSEPSIVPGHAAESPLIERITSTDRAERMPPPKVAAALTAEQIKILRTWIDQGAEYSEHWAFLPPKRPALPSVQESAWPQSPVDHFVLSQLERHKLPHAAKASREALIRRATLDLLGLPPTPDEVKAFVADESPKAFERLVDRLLESPQYGERWGRHWLDVARYADSGGFETDIFFGHAWRFRDYVIRAFNADKPFDQFIREQVAGDELYPGNKEARLATGLFTTGPVLQEAGMVTGKLEYDQLTDAADTTGSAFLGLTMGCARCHDHKYDPISQKEYFGLQAMFAASDQYDLKPDGSILRGRAALRNTLKEFQSEQVKARDKSADPAVRDEHLEIPVRVLAHREKPVQVKLLKRGELDDPGDVVEPHFPAKLGSAKAFDDVAPNKRRTELAEWVASRQNPLTARVTVNRIWQWHFGQGIVPTPNDFGIRGERPTHPELLDWLAVEFMENQWSFKHLHRAIMLSNTYQMASTADRETVARDPNNRHLTRFQPRRLEAEVVWDSLRAVSGALDLKMFGLPIAPPLDDQEQIGNFRKWPTNLPEESNRRAIYILVRRSFRFPMLSAFDLPDNISSCGCRDITTVPTQALTLLNNKTIKEQAGIFADRLIREADSEPEKIADLAWSYAYSRPITNEEREKASNFIRSRSQPVATDHREALKTAVEEFCLALFNTNEFIYLQ